MMTNNLFIDIHVLQSVPSANLNRDDTGAPKTALYGGVTRSRVSSQSWKRAMRISFNKDNLNQTGIRTKDAVVLISRKLKQLNTELDEESALEKAQAVLTTAKIKVDKNYQTGALLMISQGQVDKLAQYALNHDELDKKEVTKVLKGNQSLDLALFGRMVADNPELNVDASAQVAHAISTHEITPEYDYFTALDDLQEDDTTGAAMLGSIEYNSATLYRYANLNFHELESNVGVQAAIQGALSYIKTFVLSMPTGKQNTFANKTLPGYVMVTLHTDTPVNLVSAFEEPVSSEHGYFQPSVKRLENEYEVTQKFIEDPMLTVVLSKTKAVQGESVTDFSELLTRIKTYLQRVIENENINN